MPIVAFDTVGNIQRSDSTRVFGGDNLIIVNNQNITMRDVQTNYGFHVLSVNVTEDTGDTLFTFDNNDEAAWASRALTTDFSGLVSQPTITATGTTSTGNIAIATGAGGFGTGIRNKAFTGADNVITFTGVSATDLSVAVGNNRNFYMRIDVNPVIRRITDHDDNTDIENTGEPTRFVDYWIEEGVRNHGTNLGLRDSALVYLVTDSAASAL